MKKALVYKTGAFNLVSFCKQPSGIYPLKFIVK